MSQLSPFESLSHSTIRIECDLIGGGVSTGTGFFFRFVDKGENFVPAIVTNKHVVEDTTTGRFYFTLSKPDGSPAVGSKHLITIPNFQKAWTPHPDPDIDLCAMPISTIIEETFKKGLKFFATFLDVNLIPSPDDVADMGGMEQVVMVGYPNGIWDRSNNLPVFRSGVMATHYRYDWNGKPEFLIDAACFPGSSGSPVLIIDIGQVQTKSGWKLGSSRVKLLGVLYAGPQHTAQGEATVVPVPTTNTIVSRTSVPNNLGIIIKSEKLRELDAEFARQLAR